MRAVSTISTRPSACSTWVAVAGAVVMRGDLIQSASRTPRRVYCRLTLQMPAPGGGGFGGVTNVPLILDAVKVPVKVNLGGKELPPSIAHSNVTVFDPTVPLTDPGAER